jgi:hypothetical protein
MTDVEYNDESARSAINQFNQLGDELNDLANSLAGELSGDSPWSNDKIGSAFGSGFDPKRTNAIGNVQDFAKRVESFGPAINDASARITDADNPGSA